MLRKHRSDTVADALERLIDDVAESASPFLDWLSEAEAQLRSGHHRAWLRKRFPAWQRQGLARWNPHRSRERQYLKVAIPLALNLDAIRADAVREAQRSAS